MENGKIKLIEEILHEPPVAEPPDELIVQLICSLNNERQERVIKAHFGIGEPKKTLEKIAASLSLTTERVRQIELKTLGRLKYRLERSEWSESIKPYMTGRKARWESLEQRLQKDLGASHPIPKDWEPQVFEEIYEQHLRASREGRISQTLDRKDVFERLYGATRLIRKWQEDRWRPE